MIAIGDWDVEILKDNWTAVTRDRSLSAHYEHTIAVTAKGPEILSQRVKTRTLSKDKGVSTCLSRMCTRLRAR